MAVANFQELCDGLCELAGVRPPDTAPDEQGCQGMTFMLDGVTVELSFEPHICQEHVLVRVNFGALPAGRELQACRALMEFNTRLRGIGPAFSRHPQNGDIVCQSAYSLMQATAHDLHDWCLRLIQAAREWREPSAHAGFHSDFVESAVSPDPPGLRTSLGHIFNAIHPMSRA